MYGRFTDFFNLVDVAYIPLVKAKPLPPPSRRGEGLTLFLLTDPYPLASMKCPSTIPTSEWHLEKIFNGSIDMNKAVKKYSRSASKVSTESISTSKEIMKSD